MKHWNSTEEGILRQMRAECKRYQEQHCGNGNVKNRWRLALALTIALLSVVSGAVNFAVDNGEIPRPGMKYSVGAVNFCTAGVTWLSSKLNMGRRVESHRAAARSYAILMRNIDMELDTHRRDRTTSGATFLHVCIEHMNKVLEEAPELGTDVSSARFHLS